MCQAGIQTSKTSSPTAWARTLEAEGFLREEWWVGLGRSIGRLKPQDGCLFLVVRLFGCFAKGIQEGHHHYYMFLGGSPKQIHPNEYLVAFPPSICESQLFEASAGKGGTGIWAHPFPSEPDADEYMGQTAREEQLMFFRAKAYLQIDGGHVACSRRPPNPTCACGKSGG